MSHLFSAIASGIFFVFLPFNCVYTVRAASIDQIPGYTNWEGVNRGSINLSLGNLACAVSVSASSDNQTVHGGGTSVPFQSAVDSANLTQVRGSFRNGAIGQFYNVSPDKSKLDEVLTCHEWLGVGPKTRTLRDFVGDQNYRVQVIGPARSRADRSREINALVSSILERYDHAEHRTTVMSRLNALEGSPKEGAKVFKRACQACHRIGNNGTDFGPSLSDVGKRLRFDEILESVLLPSKTIDPKYRTTNILTVDGNAISGLVVAENKKALTLVVGQGGVQRVLRDEIDVREQVDVSSMPEKLHKGMSGAELLDLLKFLVAQQAAPLTRSVRSNR